MCSSIDLIGWLSGGICSSACISSCPSFVFVCVLACFFLFVVACFYVSVLLLQKTQSHRSIYKLKPVSQRCRTKTHFSVVIAEHVGFKGLV